jgi:Zn-dependent protease
MLRNGSLFLFRLFGVSVFVHWSWALVAVYEVMRERGQADVFGHQHSIAFHIVLYLGLFAIVLIHEFGHALACKSVGGKAERIVLWPLGGLAFVQPPPRPGATLWSIAAGPLVNVVLVPILFGAGFLSAMSGQHGVLTDFIAEIAIINLGLLIFNVLPIYPLDGGQILQSLLWFAVGRGTSMIISGWLGILGAIGLAVLAWMGGAVILGLIVVFIGMQSFQAVKIGKLLLQLERGPRHEEARCPACGKSPPAGPFWGCRCGARFDTFATGTRCPQCATQFASTACPLCGRSSPSTEWFGADRGAFPVEPSPLPAAAPLEQTLAPNPDAPEPPPIDDSYLRQENR